MENIGNEEDEDEGEEEENGDDVEEGERLNRKTTKRRRIDSNLPLTS